jgi:mannose/cellobiose epimerase-like protein (N-acyl-D-glucosamine 2-epimerase family)
MTVKQKSKKKAAFPKKKAEKWQSASFPALRMIGSFSLEDLVKQYRSDLFDDFLPFMDKYVVDHKRGGFMTNVDRDGTLHNTVKNTWYCGRGIWVYSFLYNNLAREQKFLDIAAKSVKFVLRHMPQGDTLWTPEFTQEGEPIILEGQFIGGKYYPVNEEVSGDLFIANGLAEFSRAAGDSRYFNLAKEIILKCVRIFDRPDYAPNAVQVYLGKDASSLPGARIMGVSMLLLNITSQMLAHRADAELEGICQRAVDAILKHHYNPEYGMLNEVLTHDFSRPENEYRNLVYTGHAIETMWMMLYEAYRRQDRELFRKAESLLQRHIEVAWDTVFGGFFRGLKDVYANLWILDKPLWTQEEVLIGTLFLIEHTGAKWAQDWFARTYAFVQEKYPLRKHGFALYDDWPDRLVTFVQHHTRVEIFHHPRHLMQNLISLQNNLERGGKPSGFLSA